MGPLFSLMRMKGRLRKKYGINKNMLKTALFDSPGLTLPFLVLLLVLSLGTVHPPLVLPQ